MIESAECQHVVKTDKLRTTANGATCIVPQCDECGQAFQAVPKIGRELAKLPLFDPDKNRIYREARYQQFRENRAVERVEASKVFWASYDDYMASPEWKSVSQVVVRRDVVCQCCFRVNATQAHHLSYATYKKCGFTFPAECVGICQSCHDKIPNSHPV